MAMEELSQQIKTVVESTAEPSPLDHAEIAARKAAETAERLDGILEGTNAREAQTLVARYRWAADYIGAGIQELQNAKTDMEALFVRWGIDPADVMGPPPFTQAGQSNDLRPQYDDTDPQQTSARPSAWTAEAAALDYQQYTAGNITSHEAPKFYVAPEGEPIVRVSDRNLFDPVVQQRLDQPIESAITFPEMATDNPNKKPLARLQKAGVRTVRDAVLLGDRPFNSVWGVRVEPADAAAQIGRAVPDVPLEHPQLPCGPAKAAQICERLDQIPLQVLKPGSTDIDPGIKLSDIIDPATNMPKIPPRASEHKTRIKMGLPRGYGYHEYEAAVQYVREFRRVRRRLFGEDNI